MSCLRSQQPCRFAKQNPSCFMFLPSTSYMFAGLDTSMLGKHCSGFCFLEKSFPLSQVSRYPFGHRTNQHSLTSLRSLQKGTLSADVFCFFIFSPSLSGPCTCFSTEARQKISDPELFAAISKRSRLLISDFADFDVTNLCWAQACANQVDHDPF